MSFAERIIREGGKDSKSRINWALNAALSRQGNEKEIKILSELQTKQFTRYNTDANAANELNTVGIKIPPKDIPPAELASWTTVARTILNLHETITRH